MATRVFLKERETKDSISLYLFYRPGIRDPRTMKIKHKETIGRLHKNPKTAEEKEYNKEVRRIAEATRMKHELAILCDENDIFDKSRLKADFLQYLYDIAKRKDGKWMSTYYYFDKFMDGCCSFGDLNEEVCEKFRLYLLNTKQLKHEHLPLSHNSAAAYFRLFRSALKQAYKDKWLRIDHNDHINGIKDEDSFREHLTLEELKTLSNTPCKHPILKRASLFSALTGLRKGDVLSIKWKHITPASTQESGYVIRKKIEKKRKNETLPLNPEALAMCGERRQKNDLIFEGLKKAWTDKPFKDWVKSAGIEKPITFHCLRHSYATLLIDLGVDLYTIKGLLTHKHIQTTEIYAKTSTQNMKEASRMISLTQNNTRKA
jgi:integrase